MKSILWLAMVVVLAAGVLGRMENPSFLPTASTSVESVTYSPMMVWGGKRDYLVGQDLNIGSRLSPWDVTSFLGYLLSAQGYSLPSSLKSIRGDRHDPKVVLVLLPGELRTDLVAYLSNAYDINETNRGSLTATTRFVKTAPSSFVAPAVSMKESSVKAALQDFTKHGLSRSSTAIHLVRPDGIRSTLEIDGARSISLDELESSLSTGDKLVHSHLVILDMPTGTSEDKASMAAADIMIEKANAVVERFSDGQYAAVLVPANPPHRPLELSASMDMREKIMSTTNSASSNVVTGGQIYMSSSILQALLTLLLLALVGLSGLCCLCRVQTPTTFENPKSSKRAL